MEPSLVRYNKDNDFNNHNLIIKNSITLYSQGIIESPVITKAYVDQFHNDNERNRRDVGFSFYNEEVDLVKNNQDNDFNDNKSTILYSITVNRNPSSNHELAKKSMLMIQ